MQKGIGTLISANKTLMSSGNRTRRYVYVSEEISAFLDFCNSLELGSFVCGTCDKNDHRTRSDTIRSSGHRGGGGPIYNILR
jgi:hypothetical protein